MKTRCQTKPSLSRPGAEVCGLPSAVSQARISCPPSSHEHELENRPCQASYSGRRPPSCHEHRLENPCYVSEAPTGRPQLSPGQRPGLARPDESRALTGRNKGGVR